MDTVHVLFKEIPLKLMMIYYSLALVMFCSLSLSALLLSSVELKNCFYLFFYLCLICGIGLLFESLGFLNLSSLELEKIFPINFLKKLFLGLL